MSPVGIFGGSFDPIHLGHLITTKFVLEKRNLEKIIFIPANISPFKTNLISLEAQHRINMVKLAIKEIPFFEVSDYEISKGDISYTYDTLIELNKYYDNLELIIGYDNLFTFDKWRYPDKILEIAKLVVMKRNTDTLPFERNYYFDSALLIDTPAIDISSTTVRTRIKSGLPIDDLVPESVKEYISQNHLYE